MKQNKLWFIFVLLWHKIWLKYTTEVFDTPEFAENDNLSQINKSDIGQLQTTPIEYK